MNWLKNGMGGDGEKGKGAVCGNPGGGGGTAAVARFPIETSLAVDSAPSFLTLLEGDTTPPLLDIVPADVDIKDDGGGNDDDKDDDAEGRPATGSGSL